MIFAALFTRPVQRKPVRFLATVAGIAAGVAAVVATLGATGAALSSLRRGVGELSGGAVLEVTSEGDVPETELTRLAPLASDAILLPVIERVATCTTLGDTVRIFGVDLFSDPRFKAGRAEIVAVDPPIDDFMSKSAVVSEELARDAHIGRGGVLRVMIAARPVDLVVVGTFPSGSKAVLGRLVVVDIALAQRLFDTDGRVSRIEIVPRSSVSLDDLGARARELVSPGLSVATPGERSAEANTLVRSLEFNLGTMSAISLLVGGVLVATTLATSIVQRRRTIALLYSLGASRPQVMRSIFLEALLLGLLGGVSGVLVGHLASSFLVDGMRATLSTVVSTTAPSTIPFNWVHAAIGLGLGVFVSLSAAILPVFEGARTPPIQALRGEVPRFLSTSARMRALLLAAGLTLLALFLMRLDAWHGLPIAALAACLAFLAGLFALFGPLVDAVGRVASAVRSVPPTARLACAALSAGRRRAAWAAGAVGVAVALSIAIATMVGSFRGTVVDWVERSIHADLAVRAERTSSGLPIGGIDPAIVDIVRTIPGVAEVYPYFIATAQSGGQRIGLAGVSFEATAARGWSAMLDGSDSREAIREALRSNGVLVSEAGARKFGWAVGESVDIEAGGVTLKRRISGVYMDHSESQGVVLVDEGTFKELYPHEHPLFVDMNCRTPQDIEPVRSRLREALGGTFAVEINDNPTIRSGILAVFDKTFEITGALQVVSAIVAIIAVLSVLFALVSERRADIALLASIGATRPQVRLLVATQAGLLGFFGASLGSLCGLAIGYVLVTVVNLQSFGWSLAFEPPVFAMLTIAVVVALACAVAGFAPAQAAARGTLRDALREE